MKIVNFFDRGKKKTTLSEKSRLYCGVMFIQLYP